MLLIQLILEVRYRKIHKMPFLQFVIKTCHKQREIYINKIVCPRENVPIPLRVLWLNNINNNFFSGHIDERVETKEKVATRQERITTVKPSKWTRFNRFSTGGKMPWNVLLYFTGFKVKLLIWFSWIGFLRAERLMF